METIKNVGEAPQLGDGRKPEAWFWREGKDVSLISNRSEKELQKLNEEGEYRDPILQILVLIGPTERRVRYFRMWATWKRWDEEWHILGAEFDRTVRSFEKMGSVWRAVAEKAGLEVRSEQEKHAGHMARLRELSKGDVLEHGAMPTMQNISAALGRRAYAYKKASFYDTLKADAKKAWSIAGAFDNGRGWDGWTASGGLCI
ncbi:hypothetical protein EXIGLDRAFT_633076 [Exidia glandulosa HHB12029]|uniref:Uncharacterized protein n=1 Tax=Exidia glandulosa HHB12029 TaxID=1314781 RepID=A0A166N8K2_EXIGL|nr:hypothetical protein EXIGLDRAFT_633076 [Exidia glandulosa HHB12029]